MIQDAKDFLLSRVVKKENGCWEYTKITKQRYGYICFKGKHDSAHRFSYIVHHGAIPYNMIICHKCDNPPCVNPDHLFLGTHKENMQDMINKKRQNIVRGERQGKSILNENKVIEIRKLLSAGETCTVIAKKFNVGRGAIRGIETNATWKHVK